MATKLNMGLSLLLLAFFMDMLIISVRGHGRLVDPPSRNAMWRFGFPNPPNYSDNELNCGGFSFQWTVNGGKCGVCGDPYGKPQPHIYPGKYANGIIARTYKQGQVITAKVHITANHKGYFTFQIGDIGSPPITDEKLSHILKLAGTDGTKYYLPQGSGSGFFDVSLQLPMSLVCNHCVLRWWYTAGNNWGSGVSGSGVGIGAQETFVNCADVRIISNGGGKPPTSAKPTGSKPTTETLGRTKPTTEKPMTKKPTTERTTNKMTTIRPTTKPYPTTSKPKEPKPSGEKCKGAGIFSGQAAYDWWCKINCPMNCPKSHCTCNPVSKPNTEIPKPTVCRSAGAYAGMAGMDDWCLHNCGNGYCPKTHCSCD